MQDTCEATAFCKETGATPSSNFEMHIMSHLSASDDAISGSTEKDRDRKRAGSVSEKYD